MISRGRPTNQKAILMNNIEQEFRDLHRGWVTAYLQGDAELFDRIWIEGYIFTFPFGRLP